MIEKPNEVRVMARPRTRIENPSPTVKPKPTSAENQNLPQGRWVGRWVGKSRVHRTLEDSLDTISPTGLKWEVRLKIVLEWMLVNGVTNRAALFAGCPAAGNSASLHHAAIRKLKRMKLIERVWREYVFCVDNPVEAARARKLI